MSAKASLQDGEELYDQLVKEYGVISTEDGRTWNERLDEEFQSGYRMGVEAGMRYALARAPYYRKRQPVNIDRNPPV